MRSRAVILLALLCALAGQGSALAAPSPVSDPSERPLVPPSVAVGDTVEFTVTDDRVVQFWIQHWSSAENPRLEVRVRRADAREPRPPRWTSLRPTTAEVLRRALRPGKVLCLSAREPALTPGGPPSAWSEPECVVRPYDDARVRSHGSPNRVAARALHDGRGTVVDRRSRLSLARVPAGGSVGVLVAGAISGPGEFPTWRVGRARYSSAGYGGSWGGLSWMTRTTRRAGTLTITSAGPSNAIGGVVVLPRWLTRG